MRQGDILLEGSATGYQPLGAFGQPVHHAYVQLRAAIERRLGARYANFFARPQMDERSQTIRWVAPIAGKAVSWRDLDPADRADRALELQIMRAEFERYRQELLAEAPPASTGQPSGGRAFAAVLEQALKTPNDAHLHFIGDQPVATFWGFSEPGQKPFEPLAAAPPPAAAPASPLPPAGEPTATVVAPRRRWWPWALLLLPLLLLLLLFLLWPRNAEIAGWKPPVTLQSMLHPEDKVEKTFKTVDGRIVYERGGRYYDAQGVLVDPAKVVGGTAVDGVATGEAGATAEGDGKTAGMGADQTGAAGDKGQGNGPSDNGQQGKDQQGDDQGQDNAGNQPETPPADKQNGEQAKQPDGGPQPQEDQNQQAAKPSGADQSPNGSDQNGDQQAPGNQPPPGPPLSIPSAAAAGAGNGPADFVAGRWRSQSGLVDQDTGTKLSQTYQFDKSGQGRSTVRRSNGMECSAPAQAAMENGKLMVRELDNLKCPDGQAFEKSTTTCTRDASGQTRCTGANAGGTGYEVKIDRAGP